MFNLLPFFLGGLGAVVGAILWVVGVHLYKDHQLVHALVGLENQRQAAAQAPK